MKATVILLVVVLVVGLLWIRASHTPEVSSASVNKQKGNLVKDFYNNDHLQSEPSSEQYRYADFQLFPIVASTEFLLHHQHLGPYLSLQEAMDHRKIVITELTSENSASGRNAQRTDESNVNQLFVENISADTIIILGGEVVRGG